MSDSQSSEDADFELMWKLWLACDRGDHAARAELLFPSWLAMWRRIARDYILDALWHAATGESMRGTNGPFPVWPRKFQDECREYLVGIGALAHNPGAARAGEGD